MFCINCGKEILIQGRFCIHCGAAIPEPLAVTNPSKPKLEQIATSVCIEPAVTAEIDPVLTVTSSIERELKGNVIDREPGMIVAELDRRFFAFIIDAFILGLMSASVGYCTGYFIGLTSPDWQSLEEVTNRASKGGLIVGVIACWMYQTVLVASPCQGTIGKVVMKLKICTVAGKRLSFLSSNARELARILTGLTFGVGYALALFSDKKQALHDSVSGTIVCVK